MGNRFGQSFVSFDYSIFSIAIQLELLLAILVTLFFAKNFSIVAPQLESWDCDLGFNNRIRRLDRGKLLGNIQQISSSLFLIKFAPCFVKAVKAG